MTAPRRAQAVQAGANAQVRAPSSDPQSDAAGATSGRGGAGFLEPVYVFPGPACTTVLQALQLLRRVDESQNGGYAAPSLVAMIDELATWLYERSLLLDVQQAAADVRSDVRSGTLDVRSGGTSTSAASDITSASSGEHITTARQLADRLGCSPRHALRLLTDSGIEVLGTTGRTRQYAATDVADLLLQRLTGAV